MKTECRPWIHTRIVLFTKDEVLDNTMYWDLRGVAGGDGELGCLCGKAGTSHLCDGSAHSSGCVVNGYGCRLSYYYYYCALTVDIMYTTQDCDDGGKLLNFIGICTICIHPHLCICHSIHGTEHH